MNGLLEVDLNINIFSDESFALDFLAALLEEVLHVVTLRRVSLKYHALGVRDCEQLLLVH